MPLRASVSMEGGQFTVTFQTQTQRGTVRHDELAVVVPCNDYNHAVAVASAFNKPADEDLQRKLLEVKNDAG
jgi:hypothetical protein